MEKIIKRTLSLLMVLLMVATVAFAAPTAQAGSDAAYLDPGKTYTGTTIFAATNKIIEEKISVAPRGYLTIEITKPFMGSTAGYYQIYITDEYGHDVWSGKTIDRFDGPYSFSVGLQAGVYTVSIILSGVSLYDDDTVPSAYSLCFTTDNNWEIEPNNTRYDATELSLGSVYTGVFTDEFGSFAADYYMIKTQADKYYRVTLDKCSWLNQATISFLDSLEAQAEVIKKEWVDMDTYCIDFYSEAANTYYVKINGAAHNSGAYYDISFSEIVHNSDGGTAIIEASYGRVGEMVYKCKDCGIELKREKVPAVTAPTGFKATDIGEDSVTLEWDEVGGSGYYYIVESYENDFWYDIDESFETAGSTGVTISGLTKKKYKLRLVAVDNRDRLKNYISEPIEITLKGKSENNEAGSDGTKVKKPAKVKLSSVKAAKKKLTVTWKAVKNANGYQVAYSTAKKFTKKATKTKLIKKAKTVKTTIKKLKSKKKYFVKVRAYKTVNGTKLYGAYSKVKNVKVK